MENKELFYRETFNRITQIVNFYFETQNQAIPKEVIADEKIIIDLIKTYLNQPTFSECIKEWESRGFEVSIAINQNLVIESEKYDLDINICKANLIYEISNYYRDKPACISPELHQLLTKTLKALEVEDER